MEHYCLDNEWACLNTLCIPLEKHCDGHMNCYDHSDEYNCGMYKHIALAQFFATRDFFSVIGFADTLPGFVRLHSLLVCYNIIIIIQR